MFDYPNKLDIIFDKLYKYDIKPIIVGGYIRDYILQIDSKDIDIELYGIDSLKLVEDILQEFGDINMVGRSFGVCKLKFEELEIDFSLPRTDSKTASGHKGFTVTTDKNLNFKSAASRRDFTVNAIGYNVKNKKILDPYNGIGDIHKKILRAVNIEKFSEDPLRVLRGIQLSSRLNFRLDNNLLALFNNLIKNNFLKELPRERIYEELKKLLLKSTTPSIGLQLLKKLDILKYFTFNESYEQIDYFAKNKTNNEKINLLIFFSLLYTKESIKNIEKITLDQKLLSNISLFLEEKEKFTIHNHSNYTLYKLATKVNIETFFLYLDAYYSGKEKKNIELLREKYKSLNVFHQKLPPLIQGKELISLGLSPSKNFTLILHDVYEAQMKEEFKTKDEAYKYLKSYLLNKNLL